MKLIIICIFLNPLHRQYSPFVTEKKNLIVSGISFPINQTVTFEESFQQ